MSAIFKTKFIFMISQDLFTLAGSELMLRNVSIIGYRTIGPKDHWHRNIGPNYTDHKPQSTKIIGPSTKGHWSQYQRSLVPVPKIIGPSPQRGPIPKEHYSV